MPVLYFLESIRTPLLDGFFSLVTHFGEETLFIAFGLLLFWCVDKKEGYYLLCIGLLGTMLNQLLKLLFRIPRPWVRTPGFTIVESARAGATGYSFPSGHTQTSIGVYGAIARWTNRRIVRIPCIALCVLVPLSRMYLGVHTPLDVGVSALLALALVFGLYPLLRSSCADPRRMRPLLWGMVLFSAAYLTFVLLFPFPDDVDATNLAHSMKNAYMMLGCTLGVLLIWELDHRFIRFDTHAPLSVQAVKLIAGLVLLMGIKAGLKTPLLTLFGGHAVADGVRYFLAVAFAGCVWPLTFPWLKRTLSPCES